MRMAAAPIGFAVASSVGTSALEVRNLYQVLPTTGLTNLAITS